MQLIERCSTVMPCIPYVQSDGGPRALAAVNAYLPRPKVVAGVNLLSGKNEEGQERTQAEQSAEAGKPREIISFLKPNLTITLVDDATVYERSAIEAQVSRQALGLRGRKSDKPLDPSPSEISQSLAIRLV